MNNEKNSQKTSQNVVKIKIPIKRSMHRAIRSNVLNRLKYVERHIGASFEVVDIDG